MTYPMGGKSVTEKGRSLKALRDYHYLIAEDEDDHVYAFRSKLRSVLQNPGYLNATDKRTPQAVKDYILECFEEGNPIDVMLLDHRFDGSKETGLDILRFIRNHEEQYSIMASRRMGVISTTSHSELPIISDYLQLGICSFLVKGATGSKMPGPKGFTDQSLYNALMRVSMMQEYPEEVVKYVMQYMVFCRSRTHKRTKELKLPMFRMPADNPIAKHLDAKGKLRLPGSLDKVLDTIFDGEPPTSVNKIDDLQYALEELIASAE